MNLISMDPKVLDAALAAIKPCVATRSAVAALAGVRITSAGGVALHATDMETRVTKRIPTAVAQGELDVVVSHAELHKTAKLFKGKPVTLTHDDDGVHVTNGSRTVTLVPLRHEDFPATPDTTGDHWLTLHATTLTPVIERALLFASPDETRPILTGVFFEHAKSTRSIRVTATDSYRLVTTTVLGSSFIEGEKAIVPGRALKMIVRSLKKESGAIRVYRTNGDTSWELPDTNELWTTRTIDGSYPNHRQLIPEESAFTATVVAPRAAMIESVAVANQLSVRNMPVRLGVNGQFDVKLQGVDSPSMEECIHDAQITHVRTETAVGATPPDFEYGINPAFLLDTLKAATGDEVTFHFISPLRPVLVTEPGTEFLVMPIRLNV